MRVFVVFFAGIVTTVVTMVLMLLLQDSFNLMGFYLWHVVPVGAICMGALAASGYVLAVKATRAQVRDSLFLLILGLHLLAYFGSWFLEYRLLAPSYKDGRSLTFWEFYGAMARAISFARHNQPDNPIGVWGYGIRFLETVGFVSGALAVPMALGNTPACPNCRRFHHVKSLGLLPAEGETQITTTQAVLNQLQESLDSNNAQVFTELVETHADKKLTGDSVSLRLAWCPGCHHGQFIARPMAADEDVLIDEQLTPDFVKALPLKRLAR
jgi:hypothetical protein